MVNLLVKRSFTNDMEPTLKKIGKCLIAKSETIAVAESVTSGVLQTAFASIPDAAKFFHGGITAYNVGQKYKHLSVEPVHALAVNCVSQQVANEMAKGVATQFTAHWGIGITGYATPVPESGNKLFAYYAVWHSGKILAKGKLITKQTDPQEVQKEYAKQILSKLAALLK